MATLTVQKISRAGIDPTYNSVASQDKFLNDGKTMIHIKNGGGTQDNVTIPAIRTCSQGQDHSIAVTVPITTGQRMIGPFPQGLYNDANGYVTINHSFITSVTIALWSDIDG